MAGADFNDGRALVSRLHVSMLRRKLFFLEGKTVPAARCVDISFLSDAKRKDNGQRRNIKTNYDSRGDDRFERGRYAAVGTY